MRLVPILAAFLWLAAPAGAETLRVATYDVELSRDGPGVLLHELTAKPKERALAVAAIIRAVRPDVLVLQKLDHDPQGRTLAAFAALLREGPDGIDYPHRFTAPVNAGRDSGLDLDGDTLLRGPADALGWGKYPGHGGMAILSQLPLDLDAARSFRGLLWRDLQDAGLPRRGDGSAYLAPAAEAALPLSSRSHWDVPVILQNGGRLHLLTAYPTPPLFDGPEGMNRLRNRDELMFWAQYLDGRSFRDDKGRDGAAPDAALVLLGDFNLDPRDGAGEGFAVQRLIEHPRLQDPAPASAGAAEAGGQGGANLRHRGDPALDTADWRDEGGPGNLRVDYLLPSAELEVAGAGVFWPEEDDPQAALIADGPSHRLVWADIRLP